MIYSLREDIVKDEENNKFKVYGICVKYDCGEKNYSDIFFEKDKAISLVEFCNKNKPSLELLEMVIQNLFE